MARIFPGRNNGQIDIYDEMKSVYSVELRKPAALKGMNTSKQFTSKSNHSDKQRNLIMPEITKPKHKNHERIALKNFYYDQPSTSKCFYYDQPSTSIKDRYYDQPSTSKGFIGYSYLDKPSRSKDFNYHQSPQSKSLCHDQLSSPSDLYHVQPSSSKINHLKYFAHSKEQKTHFNGKKSQGLNYLDDQKVKNTLKQVVPIKQRESQNKDNNDGCVDLSNKSVNSKWRLKSIFTLRSTKVAPYKNPPMVIIRNKVQVNSQNKMTNTYSNHIANSKQRRSDITQKQNSSNQLNSEHRVDNVFLDGDKKSRVPLSSSEPVLKNFAQRELQNMQSKYGPFLPFTAFVNVLQAIRARGGGVIRRRGYVVPKTKSLGYKPVDLKLAKSEIAFVLNQAKQYSRNLEKEDKIDGHRLCRKTTMIRIDGVNGMPGISAAAEVIDDEPQLRPKKRNTNPSKSIFGKNKSKLSKTYKQNQQSSVTLKNKRTRKAKKTRNVPICRRIKTGVWRTWVNFVASIC